MDKFNCSVYDISNSIDDLFADGAVLPLYVSGSSMNPFLISRRDIVYLSAVCDTDFKKGNIVLFKRSDGALVLHRIKKVLPDGKVQVNGDAQDWCETVNKTQIIATVREIERKGIKRRADSSYWNFINFIWQMLFPLRSLIMRVWFKLRRIKNKAE